MCHRGDIRVFFESKAEANRSGYDGYTESHVCKKTGRVRRFGGIKSPVRELYTDVMAGQEPRLRFRKISTAEMMGSPSGIFAECLERANVVVVAMGYETNTVPLLGPEGTKLEW